MDMDDYRRARADEDALRASALPWLALYERGLLTTEELTVRLAALLCEPQAVL